MRITIITGFFLPVPPVQGGATEKIWHRLAQLFAEAGHQVTFVSRTWPGFAADETTGGVRHIRVRGADHSRSLAINLVHDFLWGVRVARVLPAGDIVICNTPILPAWLGRIKPASGRIVAVVARMPKGQTRTYGKVDLLLALSESVATALRAENRRLASRIVPFPFPIDWPLHAAAAAQPATPLTVGYIGRLHPEKGIPLLLAAAAKLTARDDLPSWRIELTGPWAVAQGGGGEAFHRDLSAEFGRAFGSRLQWREPEFDPAALARCYGETDVFCYPSIAEKGETFGVAVAEAMAAGAAPIVSALGCFRELVQDEVTGLVFDHTAHDAPEHLAHAIGRLLADAAERKAIAARAQAHVRRFDYTEVSRDVLAHLTSLVSTGAAHPGGASRAETVTTSDADSTGRHG